LGVLLLTAAMGQTGPWGLDIHWPVAPEQTGKKTHVFVGQ
jgi:hypothetical protein